MPRRISFAGTEWELNMERMREREKATKCGAKQNKKKMRETKPFLQQNFLNDKKKSQNELEANAQPNLRFNWQLICRVFKLNAFFSTLSLLLSFFCSCCCLRFSCSLWLSRLFMVIILRMDDALAYLSIQYTKCAVLNTHTVHMIQPTHSLV